MSGYNPLGIEVKDEGVSLGRVQTLDFTGAGVTPTVVGNVGTVNVLAGGAGVPATTVTDETTFGVIRVVGISTDYARADHTHGSPASAAVTTLADASAAAAVVTHVALADPHTQYQRESEKDAALGYAGLSALSKLTGAQQTYGALVNTACEGNDARLSDSRTPLAHKVSHQDGGSDEISVLGLSGLLADGQTPLAHATSHKSGGSDAIKLDELAAPTDITTLDASTSAHGLMKKYPGGTSTFLRADGSFAAPTSAAAPPVLYEDEGTFSVNDTGYLGQRARLTLTSTERATLGGTGRVGINDPDIPFLSTYSPTSFTVLTDEYALQYKRLHLRDNTRAVLVGNAEIVLTGFAPGGRLVLSGAGGGS